MAYGTTHGDAALAAGFPIVAPTEDAREGYERINETRDFIARERIASIARDPIYASTLPDHAGAARPHSYNRTLGLYNGESPTIVTARARLSRGRNNRDRCRLAFAGDSRTRGAGLPATDGKRDYNTFSLPSQVREMLDGQAGEIYFDPGDSLITAMTGFKFTDTNFPTNYVTSQTGIASSVTISLPGNSTGFDLWLFRTGTTELVSISVDGGAAETYTPGTGASWKRFEKRGLASGAHTVTITVPALTSGSYSISRIAPYFGATGLTVTNAGRSSSNATHWDDSLWNTLLPTLLDPNGYAPDVVVMNLGTNWGSSTYANLQSIVTKLRTAGSAIILACFGPRTEDQTDPVFDTRRGLIYDLADEFNLPLIDHTAIIGTWPVVEARDLIPDGVHESLGALTLEAHATANALR